MSLEFDKVVLIDYRAFKGEHEFILGREAGTYFVQGKNKAHPELGPNGCGKSTLFGAVMWCLYGREIREARPAGDVVPWSGGRCGVWLRFYRDEKKHVVERSQSPNSLMLDGENATQAAIDAAVGIGVDAFMHTIIMGQFGKHFLDLSPSDQARMFNDVLQLGVWTDAADVAVKERRVAEGDASTAWTAVAADQGRLSEAEANLASEKRSAEGFAARNAKELADLRVAAANLRRELADIDRQSAQSERKGRAMPDDPAKAIAAERRRQADVNLKLIRANGTVKELATEARLMAERVSAYSDAMKKDKKVCPECHQQVSDTHLRKQLVEAKAKLSDITQRKANADQEASMLFESREDLTDNISKLEKRAAVAEGAAKLRRESERDLERAEESVDLAEKRAKTNPFAENMKRLKARIVELGDLIEDGTAAATKHDRRVEIYSQWIAAFKEIRLSIIDDTLVELEVATNRHAESLGLYDWRIEFATERVKQSGSVSSGFSAKLYPPDSNKPVALTSYSGGESQRWYLAADFGLSEILLSRAGLMTNIEIIDEPTQHLTAEGVADLLACVELRAIELQRTIYFIDHQSLDKGAFTGLITVEHSEGGSRILS